MACRRLGDTGLTYKTMRKEESAELAVMMKPWIIYSRDVNTIQSFLYENTQKNYGHMKKVHGQAYPSAR